MITTHTTKKYKPLPNRLFDLPQEMLRHVVQFAVQTFQDNILTFTHAQQENGDTHKLCAALHRSTLACTVCHHKNEFSKYEGRMFCDALGCPGTYCPACVQFCSCGVELACSHCGGVCVTCGPKCYECVHGFWEWPDNRFEDCVICERSFCYGCSEDTTNLDERLPLGLICEDCSSEMQTECTQCETIISNWYSRCEECERTPISDRDTDNSDTNETNTD